VIPQCKFKLFPLLSNDFTILKTGECEIESVSWNPFRWYECVMVCQNGVVAGFDIRKLQATTFVSDPQDFVLEAWRPPKVSLEPYLGWFDWGFHSLQTTSSDTFNNHMSLSHRKSKQIRRNRRFGEGDEDETSDLEDELVDYEGENLLVEMLGDGGTGNPVNASHLSSTHFSPTQNGIFSTANHNGTISVYEINRGGDFSSSSMTNSNEEEEEEEVVEERDEGTISIVHKVSRKFHSNPLFQVQLSPDDPNTLLSGGDGWSAHNLRLYQRFVRV